VSALPNLIIIDIALMAEACSGEEPLVYVIDWQILAAPHPNVSKKKKKCSLLIYTKVKNP